MSIDWINPLPDTVLKVVHKGASMKTPVNEVSSERLVADFKAVVADTEALLKATANQGDEKLAEIRAKAEESLRAVKDKLAEGEAAVLEKTRAAARATDVYVHENPWNAVGAAAALGLLVGFVIGRR
jgi:ElaB/YqjD/DUF883 family membrane-anchored ribosome-binding protein